MSDTYIITAKTVEEAVAIANREYADDRHEVSYEILDMPKKGFLGIGSKDAKIKVTVEKSFSGELSSLVDDIRGMKNFTDRGDGRENRENSEKKPQQNQPKQQNQQKQNRQNNQNQPKNNQSVQNQGEKTERPVLKNNNQHGQPQVQPKPKQNNNQPRQNTEKSAQAEKSQNNRPKQIQNNQQNQNDQNNQPKSSKKGSLNNQAKPQTRQPQLKHTSEDISSSEITVNSTVGLKDFVPDNKKNGSFGSSSAPRSGGMNNDVRRSRKTGKMPGRTTPTITPAKENPDKFAVGAKYDVAETDEDYKNLESLVREGEEMLEKEATGTLIPSAAVDTSAVDAVSSEAESIDEVSSDEASSDEVSLDTGIRRKREGYAETAPKRLRREAVTENEMKYALEFANTLLKNMCLNAAAVPAECPEGEEFEVTDNASVYPMINIVGEDTGILIGHHGETLDSIQYLVNLCSLRKTKSGDGDYVKIVVDIENYRAKREETLRALARRMASRAVKYKRNVYLEPMNSYERRIIHSELQDFGDVDTHSVGTDRDRKIIITYEGADKPKDSRSRRRGGRHDGARAANTQKSQSSEEKNEPREPRRPRKTQKVPIEQLSDVLENHGIADFEE